MQAKLFTFLNKSLLLMLCFLFIGSLNFANGASNNDPIQEKRQQLQEMEERMATVRNYLAYLKEPTEYEKQLLKTSVEYKMATYVAADSKSALKNLSPKIFDNTMCLAQTMGNRARVYLAMIEGFVFESEEEVKQYEKAQNYLESLETPDYSQEKIDKMCQP